MVPQELIGAMCWPTVGGAGGVNFLLAMIFFLKIGTKMLDNK